MLQNESDYETPLESNHYQNNHNNFQNPDNIQKQIYYTDQQLKVSSSTNNVNQNASNKIHLPTEKIWTISFRMDCLLECPKNKNFQSPDLAIDFLIDKGAESNIINLPTWNEIQTLHPKLKNLKQII